ncbi:MAG: single-stranded-DNA-specific exonuclease [Candidatus Saganbacteria bacterium]|uniref:Single-stranded-DNA-specific exonuclease RecJ n=1 Tax=Candidatus Saganbacteria bacterium TaxID=2575572 RepID=A0A833NSE8_UNCSA|nr:MAG: single-stranded-DNA-specific exonuclease [Candidatus Saganbacteria bacterium]
MKKWQLFSQEKEKSSQFSSELKISPLTAQVLINRGISNLKEADVFLRPKLLHLSDPFDIPQIDIAAKRTLLAKERNEKVLIYGDYDVDGVTGTVILVEALRYLGINASFYIPSRYGEGYSINSEAVKKAKDDGINLIVTVDCGISNFDEIEYANSLGIDVVVTDHHNLPRTLPNAQALVNPKMIPENHPSKHLSGAGVAFKFAWALFRRAGIKENGFLTSLLDLVALGTVADVVPLNQENRILTVAGLKILNEKKRLGIKHLAEIAGIKDKISVGHVNFALAPRINAAGRIEHASLSVKLLLSKDQVEAKSLAQEINKINLQRQGIGESIQKEVFLTIESQKDEKVIFAYGEGWHPGVIGIAASRVVDRFYRPTVLVGINDGVGRGSARSIEGFNVFALLDTCRDLFVDFGGHEGAAGFEIDPKNLPELKERLIKNVTISDDLLCPKIQIDAELPLKQITLGLIKELDTLDPHGRSNPAPLFITQNLALKDLRTVGSDGAHLKIKLADDKITTEAIGFRMGKEFSNMQINKKYNIAYNLETNEWNGFESAQLNLVDIKESGGEL